MSKANCVFTKAALLLALSASSVLPAQAYDPQARPRDNSGRQLAVALPIAPPAPKTPPASSISSPIQEATIAPAAPQFESITRGIGEAGRAMSRRLTSISTPINLSPEAKDALEKGSMAAQGLSNVAIKRISDCGTWVAVLLKNWNELPSATPATAIVTPTLEAPPMRAIEDPGKGIKLIYTSERRFRTVVGR